LSTALRARTDSRLTWDKGGAWLILALAMGLSAFLILFETRSNIFFGDEFSVFEKFGSGIGAHSILEPHNGHLIAPAHLIYAAVFSAAGPDYTILRVISVLVFLACCLLFFVLVKRRVGAILALAPTIVLLFLGSSWATLLLPFVILTTVLSVAFGLGALLALERDDGKGDLAACVLTTLAVVSFSAGLAFLVGVAVAVLLRRDRRDRLWIFLVPLLIYAAWRLWALQFPNNPVHAMNVLLIPAFSAQSLATVASAVTGLSFNFAAHGSRPGVPPPPGLSPWGQVIALVAVLGIAVRLWRGGVPRSLWVALATVLTYWAALALGFGLARTPYEARYLFAGAVLLLLVAAEAVRGLRLPRVAVVAIIVVTTVSVFTNIRQLHDAEQSLRGFAAAARADLGAIELARGFIPEDFNLAATPQLRDTLGGHLPVSATSYLAAVDRFGSYAFSPDELLDQSPQIRADADRVLASAERLSLQPATGRLGANNCTDLLSGGPTSPAVRQLRPGHIRLEANESAEVYLGRFAPDYPVALGTLTPRSPVTLAVPRDAHPRPWRIAISSAAPVKLCTS
jgi:hypothetical protein